MAKKDRIAQIQQNPDSTFVGVFITLRKGKFPRVFFTLKGKDLVPMTGGMTLGEFKNYKAVIEGLNNNLNRAKDKFNCLAEDLVTIANTDIPEVVDAGLLEITREQFRNTLDKHGIDWLDDEDTFEDDEDYEDQDDGDYEDQDEDE